MKKHALFLVLASMLMLACEPEVNVKPLKKLDQQTKDYTMFLTGSQWIYKKENYFTVDTNKVLRNGLGSRLDNSLDYEPELYNMDLFSTYHNKKFYYTSNAESKVEDGNIFVIWFEGSIIPYKCTFFSNRSTGAVYNYWFQPENVVTYHEFLPIYTLEGKTYSDVMVFESRYTGRLAQYDDVRLPVRTWYAKHVGIIRKEMSNGDFWNLISYDVKQ